MVSLRSRHVAVSHTSSHRRHTSAQRRKAIASSPFDCYLDSSSVLSLAITSDQAGASNLSGREESEESESIDQVGDLLVDDYRNSEIDSDEASSAELAQTSVVESGSGLVDEGITIAIDRQATAPRDRASKSLGQNQYKRKRSDDGDTDKDIINEKSNREVSRICRRTPRTVPVVSYIERESLWMNTTLEAIERSIKDCRGATSFLGTGEPMGEVGGNNAEINSTEIGKILKGQERLLLSLQDYIQRCRVTESKITENWKRAK